MDLAQKIQFLTLDVISTIGFGKCFGLMDIDDDPDEYVNSTHAGLEVTSRQVALGTWWTNWVPFLGPKGNPDIDTAKGFDKMIALNASMVEAREKEFAAQKSVGVVPKADMLTSFLKNGLSGDDLKTENVLQIVAGSDTTAGVLRGLLLYVLTNPRVYKTLQAEIDEAVASNRAPRAPGTIRYAQSRELEYLQAVIRESIRIFSPVNSPLSRDTPPEGDTITIDGQELHIPGGVSIIPSFKAMHRNKSVYGEDADVDVFRPERWLEQKDEKRRKENPDLLSITLQARVITNRYGLVEAMKHENDLAFGYGRWQCLGKGVALRETSNVTFEVRVLARIQICDRTDEDSTALQELRLDINQSREAVERH
jgi:cytochrome P450